MWYPCWISPLPLQHKKAGNCEIQDPLPSTENGHEKATPQHRSYSLLLKTGQKAGKSVPSLSNIPQNYSEDSSSPLNPAASVLIFCQEVLPLILFLLWSQLGISGPASFWQDTRTGSTCLLSSDPLTVGGRPCSTAAFFSFSWPTTITGRRLIPYSTQADLVLGAKLPQKRYILGGRPDGDFCSSPRSVSSSVCHNVSSNEVLLTRRADVDCTVKCLKTHLFLHCYSLQVLSVFYLNKRTPKPHQKCRSVIQWITIICVSEKSVSLFELC